MVVDMDVWCVIEEEAKWSAFCCFWKGSFRRDIGDYHCDVGQLATDANRAHNKTQKTLVDTTGRKPARHTKKS